MINRVINNLVAFLAGCLSIYFAKNAPHSRYGCLIFQLAVIAISVMLFKWLYVWGQSYENETPQGGETPPFRKDDIAIYIGWSFGRFDSNRLMEWITKSTRDDKTRDDTHQWSVRNISGNFCVVMDMDEWSAEEDTSTLSKENIICGLNYANVMAGLVGLTPTNSGPRLILEYDPIDCYVE